MNKLELTDVITELRTQLTTCQNAAASESVQFAIESVEVQLSVTVTKEAKLGAKVRFWVIEAGTEASYSQATVQRLTLTLEPLDRTSPPTPSGNPPRVLIGGKAETGED